MSLNPVLLEDTFTVTEINKEGVMYFKVSRVKCASEDGDMELICDIKTDDFPVALNERLIFTLATTLELNDTQSASTHYDHTIYHRPTRLHLCDYAAHGIVYGYEVKEDSLNVSVHISCGGLLCCFVGKPQSLRDIRYDSEIYILIKRAGR